MSKRIDIRIEAELAPIAKARHRSVILYGRGTLVKRNPFPGCMPFSHIYTPKETDDWMGALARFARFALDRVPPGGIAEPVRVDTMAVWPRPQDRFGPKCPDGLDYAVTRSDANNVRACVLDALERANYFSGARGDRHVVAGEAISAYAEKIGVAPIGNARTIIRVQSLRGLNLDHHAAELGLISKPPTHSNEWCSECDSIKANAQCDAVRCEKLACSSTGGEFLCCYCDRLRRLSQLGRIG